MVDCRVPAWIINCEDFWARLGYVAEAELDSVQQRNLASYRVPARYMVKPLH